MEDQVLSDAMRDLCHAYRVHPTFVDSFGVTQSSPVHSLVRLLQCLGSTLAGPQDAERALQERRSQLAGLVWEPVHVHWLPTDPELAADGSSAVALKVRQTANAEPYRLTLLTETGGTRIAEGELSDCAPTLAPMGAASAGAAKVENEVWRTLVLEPVPATGVHCLRLELGGAVHKATLLVAPERAWAERDAMDWGVFAPTYALRGSRDLPGETGAPSRGLGFGDVGHLSELVDWVGSRGGQAVSTLPLLAQFLDEIFEPSPYSPASRLFWNEFYLNLEALPELSSCPGAQKLLSNADFLREIASLRDSRCVDYRERVPVKRRLLEQLAQTFFDKGGDKSPEFQQFLRETRTEDYAQFRATGEALRGPWQQWPSWASKGGLSENCFRPESYRYHLYCQFRMAEQMTQLGDKARKLGLGLYLDLPIGVHGSGYDLWAEPDAFLLDCAAGAPPDICFTGGQDWGTAPLSPEGLRRQGYQYLRDVLSHHLRCAGALRIDHVMGIQRIYCVPKGMAASEGAYVGYEMDEILALLTIESVQHQSVLVGEDLGTVPADLPQALERHGIRRMHVLEYAMAGEHINFESLTNNAVACINTHDLFPFAAWCDGEDLLQRRETGSVDDHELHEERSRRGRVLSELSGHFNASGRLSESGLSFPLSSESYQSFLGAALDNYGASNSPLVLVNLEDLWAERLPQNIPGTTTEAKNWQRRLRLGTDELESADGLSELIARLAARRAGVGGQLDQESEWQ